MKKYILTQDQYFKLCELIENIPPCVEQTNAILYLTENVEVSEE